MPVQPSKAWNSTLVTPSGRETPSREVQLRKAPFPISLSPLPNSAVRRAEQPAKASLPMRSTESGNRISPSLSQPLKALPSISVSFSGSWMLSSPVPAKALPPMELRLSGRVTFFRDSQA